jgi:hypothetical protein
VIEVSVEFPIDRDVTIRIKESQAEILRALLGGVGTAIPDLAESPVRDFVRGLYLGLTDVGIGEESNATYSDFFTGSPEIKAP